MKQEINNAGTTNHLSPEDVKELRILFPFTVGFWTKLPNTLQPDGSLKLIYGHDKNSKILQRYLNGMVHIADLVVEEVKSPSEHPIG